MILTITLNPSMDYIYQKDDFSFGIQNRFNNPVKMVGGKGINAARTASLLGSEVLAFSLVGGNNGEIIAEKLQKETFNNYFLEIEEESRNAITIMHNGGTQTEIVEEGPFITKFNEKEIMYTILDILQKNKNIKIVTINGSVNTSNDLFYSELLELLRTKTGRDLKILMDISKTQLINVVNNSSYSPDFIKPNIIEFADLVGTKVKSKEEVIEYLSKHTFNIPYILVSCGEMGAVAKFNKFIYDINIPNINLVNPTGSGDATVGGIAHAFNANFDNENILKNGMACGVANALETGVGVISTENVKRIYQEVEIKAL